MRIALILVCGVVLVATGCSGSSTSRDVQPVTPSPMTLAARTAAARGTPTTRAQFPTAVIYVDAAGTPVWPTPPPACNVSSPAGVRPDIGPSIGEEPIWVVSHPLPVAPWRHEMIRAMWLVTADVEGDLSVSGRRLDGGGSARFIRPGSEGISDELRVARTVVPGARGVGQYPAYVVLTGPGCWEFTARVGEISRTVRMFVYL